MSKKRILCASLAVLLVGCTSQSETESVTATETPSAVQSAASVNDISEDYITSNVSYTNFTAAFQMQYTMSFSDDSKMTFDMDGTLETDGENAKLRQNIDSNGMNSTLSSVYHDGTLYNTYNNVNYYEDMELSDVFALALVPLDIYSVDASEYESVIVDGSTYSFVLTEAARTDLFTNRYDAYGLNSYDDYTVLSGQITQTIAGDITNESTVFTVQVSSGGEVVDVEVETSVDFTRIDSTSVEVDEEVLASYPAFNDIDLDAISDADLSDDTAEATGIETLKKRLVGRLDYEIQSDGTYVTEYNDRESYTFDFTNNLFIYSNYTSSYVYNWKGDTGGFGDSCSYSFSNEKATDDCDESVIEQMKNVKNYFLMELYYCGLSIDDLNS